ncbi:MAG: hypothetical protein V4556_01950 [Bacteroidota bacterium]
MQKNSPLSIFLAITTLFTGNSCTNEIGNSKDVAQDKIYQNYDVKYVEGNDQVEISAQFRFAGKNGTTLVLDSPSRFEIDSNLIKVDSNTYRGAYYETQRPASVFGRNHSVHFTDINNKKYTNEIAFDEFTLDNVPESALKSQPLNIGFKNAILNENDYIEITSVDSDSSFSITHSYKENSSSILIPAAQLQRQKAKKLTLSATLYRMVPLKHITLEGGMMSVTHTLKPVTIKLN